MEVFIITESGKNIGSGHLTRCLSLYQAFEERGITPKFIINCTRDDVSYLKGINYVILDWLKNRKKLFTLIKNADIVVVDSYLAGYDIYRRISNSVRIPVYIDDNNRMRYPKSTVINGSIMAKNIVYPKNSKINYILGTEYLPIRKCFWNIPEKTIRGKMKSVMLSFGGYDQQNLTPKLLKPLTEIYPQLKKNVIVRKGFYNIREIKKLADRKTNIIFNPDVKKYLKTMFKSDIAICAGGQTLYELARVGVPAIGITVADNQVNNVKGWKSAGFLEHAGWYDDRNVLESTVQSINRLRKRTVRLKKSRIGRKMVDGGGALRVTRYCIKRYFDEKIVLRKSELRDMSFTYKLSNETEVRRNSFSKRKIVFDEHKNWFLGKINEKNLIFLIAEINKQSSGQVRFDINKDKAIIGISVIKRYRGLGIGSLILKKSIDYLKSKSSKVKYIKAYVKKQNTNSAELFKKCGFRFTKKTKIKNQDSFEYIYNIRRS